MAGLAPTQKCHGSGVCPMITDDESGWTTSYHVNIQVGLDVPDVEICTMLGGYGRWCIWIGLPKSDVVAPWGWLWMGALLSLRRE